MIQLFDRLSRNNLIFSVLFFNVEDVHFKVRFDFYSGDPRMKKNMLLNIAGVAALTLLSACGTMSKNEEPAHHADKHAEEASNTEAMAQVEGQAVAAAEQVEGAMPVAAAEQAEGAMQVAEAEVPTEEQKA